MPADFHIHTGMCGHASGEMGEYVVAAKKAGLREICFTDHMPMYFLPEEERDPGIAMRFQDLPLYIKQVVNLRDEHYPFPVRLGIEADYIPGREKELAELLERYEFDFVLGSIHFIDGWGFDNPEFIAGYEKWDMVALFQRYFDLLVQSARSGLFDSLGHPDLVKKFGFRPAVDLVPLYEKTVKSIAETGVCIEVNTAGLRVPAAEIYPHFQFLTLCQRHRIPVTLGSDAHLPGLVGADFADAIQLLREAGYNEITSFSGRKKNTIRF